MLRNKILYLMVLIEACLLYVLYNSYEPVVLLWIAVLVPVFLFVGLIVSGFCINVRAYEEKIVVTRQSTHKIEMEIENKSFLPTGQIRVLGNINGVKFHTDVYLSGKSVKSIECPVDLEKCGIKNLVISKIVIFDLLKIFKITKRADKNIQVIVVPNVYNVDYGKVNMDYEYDGESEKFSENQSGDDPSEIFDIREYKSGDRLSRIHWKLTTKLKKLMVKDFSRAIPDGIEMFINNKNGAESLDVLFSIGMFILEQKGVVWINGRKNTEMEEFVSTFLENISGANTKELLEGIISNENADKSRKVICSFDDISKEQTKLLVLAGSYAKMSIVAEKISFADILKSNGICVCEMDKMDAYTAIERIVNE